MVYFNWSIAFICVYQLVGSGAAGTLRAIQWFAVGGVQVGYGVGLLLATGSISVVSHWTTNEEFVTWGWRLPFLFSLILVVGA